MLRVNSLHGVSERLLPSSKIRRLSALMIRLSILLLHVRFSVLIQAISNTSIIVYRGSTAMVASEQKIHHIDAS